MKIFLSKGLFERDAEIAPVDLLHLMAVAFDRDHIVLLEDEQATELWLSLRPEDERAWFKSIIKLGLEQANISVHRIEVHANNTSDWPAGRLTVPDAIEMLRTPLRILLENRRTDWAFLRRAVGTDRRKSLEAARNDGRLVVEHGGGLGEIAWFLRDLATAPPSSRRAWIERLRTLVVVDRDTDSTNRLNPSPQSQEILDLANEMRVPWPFAAHQLTRRAIENFLPGQALYFWAGQETGSNHVRRRELVDAFLSADFGDRRNMYHMKKGLAGDTSRPTRNVLRDPHRPSHQQSGTRHLIDADLDPAFQGLSDDLRVRLQNGFGGNIGDLYDNSHIEDRHFSAVFTNDKQAEAFRNNLLKSLFERL